MNSNANEDIKIARFININACKQVFSETYSTFLIRSHKYYWHIEDTDKQDRMEFQVRGENGIMETGYALLSCWTILNDGKEPTEKEWKIFDKDSPVVAIISSPKKVYSFLYEILDIERKNGRTHPFFCIEHKPVVYNERLNGTPTLSDAIFTKDNKFEKEKEYRFAVFYSTSHEINTYIFHVLYPYDYMDKCYFNPSATKENASELLEMLWSDDYGPFEEKRPCDIIANYNDLIVRANN